MKTISRYILTLALLITAVGGAWATDVYVVGNGTGNWVNGAIWDPGVAGNKMTEQNGVYSITFTNVDANSELLFKFAINGTWDVNYGCISTDKNELNKTLSNIDATGGMNFMFGLTEKADVTISFNLSEMTYMISTKGMKVGDDAPDVEVTTNAASKQDLFTEASFNMPAFDATAEYELVRDLAQQTSVNLIIGTGDAATPVTADTRLRIVKNNNVYVPISALSCTFSDEIEGNTILPTGFNDAKLTPQFYLQGENETWTLVTDINTETHLPNNLQPGQVYCMTLKAAEGSYYDGETPKSFTITLFQGYEVTVGAGEYATFFKDEPLCADATTSAEAELYTITEVNATEAVLSDKIDVVPSETPMLIYNPNEVEKTFLLIPTTELANDVKAADQFKGTTTAMDLPASTEGDDYYVCTGKAFVWVKSAGTIAANRCWLEIVAQPAGTRANTRSIVSGGDTTNIDATTRDALEGDYYDLQGRKVEKPLRKGIYIKNGKKVVVH